ncbi:hypothetical protein [Sphingomonas aerophila]|jgi:hypothetical protein|uniref:Uncharacterized protein n=1 Tax=Sphingomonas aerophila TaxID=1344948 RepID=A0A7W9EVU2_9SPHN|nr:hypothetical protein [Sphingomonas aerophila]MBB5716704.1 hypothetical protein [Sphingomonas aerophila]
MATAAHPAADAGEESMIILQSLLCLLREKNVLNRADIEELCAKVERRAMGVVEGPLPCCEKAASAAMADMQQVTSYIGRRYGGKHARPR